MKFGKLNFIGVSQKPNLVAIPTSGAIKQYELPNMLVSEIDAKLADTAAFC